ncbi:MAG TPA: hypothetical protein VM032_15385 [Vicinamibacterales bacterium]|nr:hypothetical protein [Vicinamibacterales bacterium]
MWALQQPSDGFVVKIIQPPSDVEGLADVLLGSLGLVGVLVLSAVVLALLFAGGLYLYRLNFGDPFPSASEQRPGDDGQAGRITR